jgi:hypothetical protein
MFGFIPTPGTVLLILFIVSAILIPVRNKERKERRKISQSFEVIDWLSAETCSSITLEEFQEAKTRAATLPSQESFDFAVSFAAILKGVLAHPTKHKLEKMDVLLRDERNLSRQFQRDMLKTLIDVHERYEMELAAFIRTISSQTENPIVLKSIHTLSLSDTKKHSQLQKVTSEIASSPIWRTFYNFGR